MSDYIIGLTGGVASGKSAVEACFRRLGVAVADADAAAREALAAGSDGLSEVVAAFGHDVLGADGQLDRAAMRRRRVSRLSRLPMVFLRARIAGFYRPRGAGRRRAT